MKNFPVKKFKQRFTIAQCSEFPRTREEALVEKSRYYFPDKKCPNGHLYVRYTSGGCVECQGYMRGSQIKIQSFTSEENKNKSTINKEDFRILMLDSKRHYLQKLGDNFCSKCKNELATIKSNISHSLTDAIRKKYGLTGEDNNILQE